MKISPIAWPPPDAHSSSPSYNPCSSSPRASPPHGAPYLPPPFLRDLYSRLLRPILFTEFQTITIKIFPRSSKLQIMYIPVDLVPVRTIESHRLIWLPSEKWQIVLISCPSSPFSWWWIWQILYLIKHTVSKTNSSMWISSARKPVVWRQKPVSLTCHPCCNRRR